jgi:hypothetical protein
MREVGLFIKIGNAYKRLELFNDENIDFNSSIQNVLDISKVFSDFTQGFTIPATLYNASILNWFEESSINQIFDYQQSFESYIEIDTIPFTKGKLKVDKGQLKDGKPYCYNVQFFGHLTSLKDTFGELKLSDLDLTPYSFAYDDTQVLNRITDGTTDYDVRFPLISPLRVWQYGTGGANDISTVFGRIRTNELLPAIKVYSIFEAIQTRFGLTFDSVFFQTKLFKRLFLYLKNASNSDVIFNYDNVTFDSYSGNTENRNINVTDSVLNYNFGFGGSYIFTTSIVVTAVTLPTLNWSFQCFRNGILVNTINGQGTGRFIIYSENNFNGLNSNLTFRVNSETGNTIDFNIENSLYGVDDFFYNFFLATIVCDTITPNEDINLNALCPDIKISDFFSGVLRMFNLTINPINETEFKIETLESWYSKGRISDITLNTNDSYDVNRVKLYNQIDFKFQQSETILNRRFFSNNQREYGNVRNAFENDGSEFKIELPFEDLLFNKFTDTLVQVGYCVDQNSAPLTPKPILLYMNDEQDISANTIYVETDEIFSYVPFGQDLIWNASNYSLNWGAEISSFYLNTISNSLFATYWQTYLTSLYDLRQRLYSYKTMLPISKLTTLQLNDRLVIEDKRYIINDYKSNLTTGLVEFNLLQDFRDILTPLIFNLSNEAQCIEVMIFIPNGATSFEMSTLSTGVTITPDTSTEDSLVTICIPVGGETTITTESGIDITTESGETLITEDSTSGTITITITYDNGITNTIIITRDA